MCHERDSQGHLGRRAVAMGLGAMLLGGKSLVGHASDVGTAGDKPIATSTGLPPAADDTYYAKPAPFTAEEFWMSMQLLLNESTTTTTKITRERVEQAFGRKFARFSPSRDGAYLDIGESWYFNVSHSEFLGGLQVWALNQEPPVFRNGPLLFHPFVARSLEQAGWERFSVSVHSFPAIGYRRNGHEVDFILEQDRVRNFETTLHLKNPYS